MKLVRQMLEVRVCLAQRRGEISVELAWREKCLRARSTLAQRKKVGTALRVFLLLPLNYNLS